MKKDPQKQDQSCTNLKLNVNTATFLRGETVDIWKHGSRSTDVHMFVDMAFQNQGSLKYFSTCLTFSSRLLVIDGGT